MTARRYMRALSLGAATCTIDLFILLGVLLSRLLWWVHSSTILKQTTLAGGAEHKSSQAIAFVLNFILE